MRTPHVSTRDMKTLEILLTALVVFLAVGGILSAAGISIGSDGIENSTHVAATLNPEKSGVRAPGPLPPGVEIAEVQGTVRIAPDTIDHVLFAVGTLPPVAMSIVVLVFLRGLVRSVRAGDPFVPANTRRLHVMGWALVLWPFAAAVGGFANNMVVDRNDADDFALATFDVPLWPLAGGLVVLVLSRVFTLGTRMRADVEGLV